MLKMMKMKINYQFFEANNLLVQRFTGDWSTEHYEHYVDYSMEIIDMKKIKKIFTDLREIDLQAAMEDEEKIRKIRNKIPNLDYLNIHLVINPVSTAISHLYQEKFVSTGLSYKYCSTIEHAIKLLGLDYSIGEMENVLKSLKNHY
jgi:hypothetical protein